MLLSEDQMSDYKDAALYDLIFPMPKSLSFIESKMLTGLDKHCWTKTSSRVFHQGKVEQ